MTLLSALPVASASPLAGVICVLGLLGTFAWIGWRFGDAGANRRLVLVVGGVGLR